MEDAGQDTVSSPATPGAVKSKLDTLPKEDLIKFAKKQVFILQKVKSRCTELEKEVEELKTKQSIGGNEDVIQALTDRLDAVLLEKAEAQQQLVSLKKENCKIKQDSMDAAVLTAQLQEQWDQLSSEHLKQIDYLKSELERFNFNHSEEICRMEHKLQESLEQHTKLKNKLSLQNAREDDVKTLQEELQLLRPTYEDQVFQLKKELELLMEEKNLQNIKVQEVEKAEFKNHLSKIGHLKKELLKFKSVHREVVSELVLKLGTYNKEHADDIKMANQLMQDIAQQYLEKEKELHEKKIKYEQELLLLTVASDETNKTFSTSIEEQNISFSESETQGKVKHLENILKDYESQQSILRDELTYTKNVKLKLEVEVQHLKDEFFHEREELEFKINELQLAKEECTCAIDKLQSQLQSTNEQFNIVANNHSHELLTLKEQHRKDILDLKANLLINSEQDTNSLVFEAQVLKEQCERLKQEKEEAISNYETLRETLVTLQDELGESAIKISQEFKAMKQQQATDVQELQQKLRSAYNEKDALLETVTRLNTEVELLSCKQSDCEELQQKVCNVQATNEELVFSLQQKDASLKELEERVVSLGFQNSNALSTLESCRNELEKLQDFYEKEKGNVLDLNHKIEVLSKDNYDLKQQYLECIKTLSDAETEKGEMYQKLSEMEKQIECFKHEKEILLSEAKVHNDEIIKLNEVKHATTKDMEQSMSAIESGFSLKEQIENLQNKLQLANVKNEEISKSYEKEQQQKLHNEEKLLSEVQGLCIEVGKLLEEKERMSGDLEKYIAERNYSLVIQEEVQNLENKLQLSNEEKEELSKLFEEAQQQKLILEENLSSELKALRDEMVKMHEEKEKLTADIERSITDRDHYSGIKEQFENLQNRLQLAVVEKEELSKFHEEEIQKKLLNEERLSSKMQNLDIEVQRLLKDKEEMTRSIEKFMEELGNSCAIKEQVVILQNKLQLEIEEKEQLRNVFEKNEQQNCLLEMQLDGFLLQMGHPPLDKGNHGYSIHTVLQAIGESITRLKGENNEHSLLLQQNIGRLQCENESQCIKLQCIIEDFGKEKLHFQAELAATLSENEALQRDLLEMRNASEKTKMENLALLARIEELSQRFEECTSEVKEQAKQLPVIVQENLEGLLEQKESDLCNLKAEFVFLKDTMEKSMAVEGDQQTAITELQMIIVNLEKVCKEKEEKSNKFKAVALKAKKELDSTRKELQTLKEALELVRSEKNQMSSSLKDLIQGAESYKNLLVEYDKQAEQLDLAKECANCSERQIEDIKRQIQAAYHQLDMVNSEKEDLLVRVETLQTNTRLLESQILDMQRANTSIDKELEAEKLLKEQKIKDHIAVLKQLEEVQTQLQKERKQLQDTMHELELVKKDAQKSTLMDMEMADYDRLVKELNQMISDKNSRLEDLEQEITLKKQKEETLQAEITSLQASVEQYEERSMKMKQLLVKTKKDLADSKQAETDHHLLQASLKGELEASQQQGESFKIQIAELTAENHRLLEQLRASMEKQQRMTNTYQQKITSLQDACSIAKAEQAAVTAEFEGYKVRVHNVLKQQKNKSSNQIEHDAARQEREHMEIILEQLKNKLHDTQNNLHINSSELQTLQGDHDTLLDRHNKMLQETVAKEAELREKLCTVQSENMVMKSEHAQVLSQLTAQNEALRNSFRDQVRHMQEDHRKSMETLQQQLSKLEAQLFQQRSDSSITSPTSSQPPTKTLRDRRAADVPLLDLYATAREEGEGMETTDTDSVSSASTYLPPLEQLLNSPETKYEPAECQPEPTKEDLVQKLNTMSKSIEHLSGLLHETEATNVVLMEQITLLKSEVRRLERNQEREKSVNNLEYLKNVLLQFIFLKAGSERQRLLPVIDTMLHLSPEEKGKLVAIALGEEEAAARPAGWASYLHSWSGLR